MSDGSRLRQSWYNALNEAEAHFRQLLTSSGPSDWRRISTSTDTPGKKGKSRLSTIPELSDVVVHRHTGKAGDDVYRMVLEVALTDEGVSLEPWKAVLTTPELRQEWDPAVEEAHLLEMFDHKTRISKTNFTLGWPANPRDAVTISRLFHDANTVIDISTSLPRSADEPAYLRPSPPFVRSHVKLFAWCIKLVQPTVSNDDQGKKKPRLRITCFWQHDFKAMWGFNSSISTMAQQLSTMTLSLFKTVIKRGGRVAKLSGYGNGVSIDRIRYQIDREALNIEYAIIPEEDEHATPMGQTQGMEEVHSLREQRRLTRSIECVLPSLEGWDVQVTTKASSEDVENLPWSANVLRINSSPSSSSDQVILRVTHTALPDVYSVLKVKVTIEVSAASSGIRLNGIPKAIVEAEERDPSSHLISQSILQDIASAADLSFNTTTSVGTMTSAHSTSSSSVNVITRTPTERSAAGEKSILSRVRRNYIYFSSLLQEPEAKWRRITEGRGVSITQLDSIDPTLVVYRAEATFVGVNLWDLFAAVVSPGARIFWDKQHEDGVLLEDVNELSELWHYKTKPAWPANGRDAVLLKTVYKSSNTIHVFSFSAEEPHLFPNVPPPEPNIIRTQVDLQGWSIEALSPTTTLLTLLEQSDPKGWTGKTSIPTQMISTLAGIGEFAIKCGGPPIVTRLAGAKSNEIRYDHEKASFRVEYEASASRRTNTNDDDNNEHSPPIELELRCDIDTWAASLDIVVDPPPQTISCLRRHRLSAEGGGLWLTLAHDALFVDDERLLTIVRKAPGKEKGLVMVNGAKIHIDVEEIPEHEIKLLTKQKRVKPARIPLDQPPVMSNIKRKKAEWGNSGDANATDANESNAPGPLKPTESIASAWASAPKISSPLTRFITYYVDQAASTTQSAVAAIAPTSASGDNAIPSSSKLPLQHALEALSWVQDANGQAPSSDWTLISDKGLLIHRKIVPELSHIIPVHKGSKVIEGVSAEELAPTITHWDCRRKWDDRFDTVKVLESYGADCQTAFLVSKAGFPFRDRGFYLASVVVRGPLSSSNPGSSLAAPSISRQSSTDGTGTGASSGGGTGGGDQSSSSSRRAIYCVSASFNPDSVASFSPAKYNPHLLPIGRVYIDAWILETLDPYTKENYMIPSTRCTRYIAVDYAGSIPAAVNSMINASIPRCIVALETYVKGSAPLPVLRLPAPSLAVGTVGRKEEEMFVGMKASAWKLRKRDDVRTVVWESFSVEDRVLGVCVLMNLPSHIGKGRSASVSVVGTSNGPGTGGTSGDSSRVQSQMTTPRQSPRTVLQNPSPNPGERRESSISTTTSGESESTVTLSSLDAVLAMTPPGASSLVSPPARHLRQRTVSSTAALSPIIAAASAFEEQRRGRSASAFSSSKRVPPGELIVAEIVVDKKMYPEGYEVKVGSRMRKDVRVGQRGGFVSLKKNTGATSVDGDVIFQNNVLPLKYAIYAMPLSPMHSSGEAGTRHLVRIVLPTAPSSSSSIDRMTVHGGHGGEDVVATKDSLTGEEEVMVRGVVKKEAEKESDERQGWWSEMAGGGGDGAVIWVQVVPATGGGAISGSSNATNANSVTTNKGSVRRKSRKDSGKNKVVVVVNGEEVGVVDEKEGLTSLGREELMDDRVGKMNVISRVPNDSEALPEELKIAIGIADDVCDTGSSGGVASSTWPGNDGEEKKEGEGEGKKKEERSIGEETPKTTVETKDGGPHVGHVVGSSGGGGGLFGFLQGYPNPLLTRFGMSLGVSNTGVVGDKGKNKEDGSNGNETEAEKGTAPGASEGDMGAQNQDGSSISTGEMGQEVKVGKQKGRTSVYPVSTLVVVAVIAFLLGSLLRSLISPADFVYIGELPETGGSGGWRELRRLFEVKYVLGGWDLQIAAVRRHER